MNERPIRKILIFTFITGVLIFIFSNMLKSRKANDLIKYNEEFMNNYINNNLANCEIKEIKQYIFVPPALEIDGGYYKEVDKDYIDKGYKKEVSVFDKELNVDYVITFSHGENEEIKISGKSREDYLENYKNYNENFELIKEIVESHSGNVTNLGSYSEENIKQYILLLYIPNSMTTRDVIYNIHDKVEIPGEDLISNINMPRYIICNNFDTYTNMLNNIEDAKNLLVRKSYECINSRLPKNVVSLKEICNTLLKNTVNEYTVDTVNQQINKFFESNNSEWICIYELETGVNYYLTLYKKQDLQKMNS